MLLHMYTPPLCAQVPAAVVSIDWTNKEAIRSVEGVEERQKLTPGDSGFAVCTWPDVSSLQSHVANLMLQVQRAPLLGVRKKPAACKKPAAACKKPAAACKKAAAAAAEYDEEGEEEEEDADGGEEEEEEGGGECG